MVTNAREQAQVGPKRFEQFVEESRPIFEQAVLDRQGDLGSPEAEAAWNEIFAEIERIRDTDKKPDGSDFATYDEIRQYLREFIETTVAKHIPLPEDNTVETPEEPEDPVADEEEETEDVNTINRTINPRCQKPFEDFLNAYNEIMSQGKSARYDQVNVQVNRGNNTISTLNFYGCDSLVGRTQEMTDQLKSLADFLGIFRLQFVSPQINRMIIDKAFDFGLNPTQIDDQPIWDEVTRIMEEKTDRSGNDITSREHLLQVMSAFIDQYYQGLSNA